jgi:hypothetical protein
MTIDWLVFGLCIALTLLFRAHSAALAIVVHAVRRGAPPLAAAGLVALVVGVHAQREAALDRSPPMTIVDAPSWRITSATPPSTDATRRSGLTWSPKLHVRRDAFLRSAPPNPPQLGLDHRDVNVEVRRPESRATVALPVTVGQLRLPPWNALVSALDREVPRAPGGGTANARAAGATFATGST